MPQIFQFMLNPFSLIKNASFFRVTSALVQTRCHLSASASNGVRNLNEFKNQFRQYQGGKIELTKDDKTGIAYLCLNHEEKKNCLSGSMVVDLNDALESLETWTIGKGLILYGKGDSFCTGMYLDTVKKILNSKDGFKMSSIMHDSAIRLSKLPLVSVAIIQGHAVGGGAELMLTTDFRLFTPSAQCRFVEAKMGVGTGLGGGILLRRLVGPSKALEILLSCRKITAEEAIKIGLVDGIISEKNTMDDAMNYLNRLIEGLDISVVRAMKQIIACNDFEEERRIFATTWGGPAQMKALTNNIKHR